MTSGQPRIGQYPYLKFRTSVWRQIVRYISQDAPQANTVVELGAGYCDFINQIQATKKIAYDLNPQTKSFAAADVEVRIENAIFLSGIADRSLDLVFASNFLEHLNRAELDQMLSNIQRVLSPSGKLILLQPNYRLCRDHYWDDSTHKTVFSDQNITQILSDHELAVVKLISGLLPFSLKSRLPKWSCLVRLYLMSPVKPFASQMYVVAERSQRHLEQQKDIGHFPDLQ